MMALIAIYACLFCAGCASNSYGDIVLDAAHPSIRYSTQGFLIGERYVDPKMVPAILKSYGVPTDSVIHIRIDEEAAHELKPARLFMGLLAHNGYRRSVLVSQKRAESHVCTDEEMQLGGQQHAIPSGLHSSPPVKRKIRYKNSTE